LAESGPEKGVDRAIEIADKTGRKLKIAAKVDPADQEYFSSENEPLLDRPFIEFVGEIGEDEKGEFLGKAAALLFPIEWRWLTVWCSDGHPSTTP
jgi:glycosyltransferase involved in cell wall biosynthesis